MDTRIGCFMKPEVGHAETEVQSRVQDRSGQACKGTRGIGSASLPGPGRPRERARKWVKEFGSDPVQAFPGHGQMKSEQLEIERLRREVNKLKAERDIPERPLPTSRRKRRHEVRLHCEAPGYLAGGMAMRIYGRIAVGLPCLAEPISQRQIPQRRSDRPAGQGQLPCQRPDLRGTARLARPSGRRRTVSEEAVSKMQGALETAGIVFIHENGGGAGVRLREKTRVQKMKTRQIAHAWQQTNSLSMKIARRSRIRPARRKTSGQPTLVASPG